MKQRVQTTVSADGKIASLKVTVDGVEVEAVYDLPNWLLLAENLVNTYRVMQARQGLSTPASSEHRLQS